MANHKSPKKAARQSVKRKVANKHFSSKVKTGVKKLRAVKTKVEGDALLKDTSKMLDKMASKGIIHKNKSANLKSKLSKFVKKLS